MLLLLSMFGGLGLDLPGEGMVAKGFGAVDQRARGRWGPGLHGEEFWVSMGAICDGQVGADLADDYGVARFAGLDDVDT